MQQTPEAEKSATWRHCGAEGPSFPTIGLGTSRLRGSACRRTIEDALNLGYRLFDTAKAYNNESEIGSSIVASGLNRQDIRICTKLNSAQLLAEDGIDAVHRSLARLQTSYIDLLLLHWPCTIEQLPEIQRRLRAAKAAGLVRAIGLSNAPRPFFDVARQGAPEIAVNQIERHLLLQQPNLTAHLRQSGVLLMAYRPTARDETAKEPKVRSIATRLGCSPHQVSLRWHMEEPNSIIIAGASSHKHLRENLASVKLKFSPDDIKELASLDKGQRTLHRPYAPEWPEDLCKFPLFVKQ